MERVTFKNSRNLTLLGNLYPAESDAIIVMCHGFCSDKYSRGRFPRLAQHFNQLGYNALAFDFSGCGESDDDSLTMAKEVDDLNAVLAFVKAQGFKKIGLYGHSLGTVICLKAFTPDIAAMVLSGAGTDSMHYNWPDFFTQAQLDQLQSKGYITEKAEGARQEVIIHGQMLKDFENVEQKELLEGVNCPVLIIHGNQDEEEQFLSEKSGRAMRFLSDPSRLEIIDGANHSFMEHYDKLMDLAGNWFAKYLI